MIKYHIITINDLPLWRKKYNLPPLSSSANPVEGIPRTGIQSDALSPDFKCEQNSDQDTVCAIVALDGEKLIGKLLIIYTDLLVNSQLQHCAIGSGFYVLDKYRDRAVGLSIMLKALNLGVPYLEAGVSGQMLKILESWKQFKRIDNSQEYQIPLNWSGLIQMSKWDFYAQNSKGIFVDTFKKTVILVRNFYKKWKLTSSSFNTLSVVSINNNIDQYFEKYFSSPKFPIQIPWNRKLMKDALQGKNPNHQAWIVEEKESKRGPWLITMYRRERHMGETPDGTEKTLREIYLNEIYPPLKEGDPITALLAFSTDQATKNMNADIFRVYAMTSAMQRNYSQFGLTSRAVKTVFIAPGTNIDEPTRKLLCDPDSWWCRAFSEDQFEESFIATEEKANASLLQ